MVTAAPKNSSQEMTILFFSHLFERIPAGLSISVPGTILAQEIVDKCFWVETNNVEDFFSFSVKSFHKQIKVGHHIDLYPQPFNKPDIVVFFGVYLPIYLTFAKQLKSNNIPYIIRPASSLTCQAQHNHAFLKKKIANILLFNRFIKEASAIHYLTEDERRDSGTKWNKHSFVLPNGINIPDSRKTEFSTIGIKACYIGRIDLYQKGLDLLLKAIIIIQKQLRESNFCLRLFGPINHDAKKIASLIKKYNIRDIVSLKGEVSGADKESAFLSSDLFILTSRFEGHSIALLEALSYGLPVAIAPGTNMKEKVQQYDAGWYCDETNADSICRMLLDVINQRKQLPIKGSNALELAKTYNYSEIAKQFHKIASQIIDDAKNVYK